MTLYTRRAVTGLIAAGAAAPAFAEPLFLDSMGAVIRGYDPVAYFEYQEATKGSWDIELKTDDGIWRFEREAHRKMFTDNPKRFTPQFGGYDALGVARGFKRQSDPTIWVMVDEKVYLHASIPGQNDWAKDVRGHIQTAEENWISLREQWL